MQVRTGVTGVRPQSNTAAWKMLAALRWSPMSPMSPLPPVLATLTVTLTVAAGIDLADKTVLVVKSTNHFFGGFGAVAGVSPAFHADTAHAARYTIHARCEAHRSTTHKTSSPAHRTSNKTPVC